MPTHPITSDLFAVRPQGSPVAPAGQWVEQLLGGHIVIGIAVLAVAVVGFEMLTGHLSMRRAARMIVGCFVLLGSPPLALSIATIARGDINRVPVASPPLYFAFTSAERLDRNEGKSIRSLCLVRATWQSG